LAFDNDVDDDETDVVNVFIVVVVLDGRLILLQKPCYLLVFKDQEVVDDDNNVCVIVFIPISAYRNRLLYCRTSFGRTSLQYSSCGDGDSLRTVIDCHIAVLLLGVLLWNILLLVETATVRQP
jgi:hypothetical protein